MPGPLDLGIYFCVLVSWWRECFATILAINIRGRVKKQGLIIVSGPSGVSAAQMALDIDICTLVWVLTI